VIFSIWIYPNIKSVSSPQIDETVNIVPEANNEIINNIEDGNIVSSENEIENVEVEEAAPIEEKKVEDNSSEQKQVTSKKTTSSNGDNASNKSSVKKEVSPEVEDKKEEAEPIQNTQQSSTEKIDSSSSISTEEKSEEPKEETVVRCTTDHNHSIGVGNCGKWYNSASEGIAEYDSISEKWGTKWENFEIDNDTYYANCPSGYQYIDCMYCGKYTFDYYYRKIEK